MKIENEKPGFQWNANDYADHSGAQYQWAKELIERLGLKGNESLLDLGCGDGKVTAEIATNLKTGRVVGIDNSEEMIALAKDRFSFSAYPNLSFLKQDVRELSFYQEFDLVFSNAVLHWVLDHRPVLKGIYQALKPNGRVIVQMGGKGNATEVVSVVHELMEQDEWKGFFKNFSFPYGFYSPEEYKPWLKDAGFTVHAVKLKPIMMVHENEEKFKGWFRTTWLPYIHRIPIELQDQFIHAVTRKYIKTNPSDHEGKIHTKMQRLEFEAKKAITKNRGSLIAGNSGESDDTIEIRVFSSEYQEDILNLIVGIQQREFGIQITAADQPDLRNIPGYYQKGNGNFWVAVINGKVVGTLSLLDIGNGQAALRKMFVNKEHRGPKFKIAHKLLNALLNQAKSSGLETIFLGTTSRFIAAHRFYEKNGFREIQKESLPKAFPIMSVDTKFYQYDV